MIRQAYRQTWGRLILSIFASLVLKSPLTTRILAFGHRCNPRVNGQKYSREKHK
ncbi:hypothetical protein D082_00950 [Synechocystis sp. PCC 6714]|nr:hypothetical protein D082_00950 [Synechocystis sp. PCC 6714]